MFDVLTFVSIDPWEGRWAFVCVVSWRVPIFADPEGPTFMVSSRDRIRSVSLWTDLLCPQTTAACVSLSKSTMSKTWPASWPHPITPGWRRGAACLVVAPGRVNRPKWPRQLSRRWGFFRAQNSHRGRRGFPHKSDTSRVEAAETMLAIRKKQAFVRDYPSGRGQAGHLPSPSTAP